MQTDLFTTESPAIVKPMLAAVTVGGTYQLDGILFRCESMKESGLGIFQQLNEDRSDYITYYKNSEGENTQVKDWGRRIIFNRINEIRCVR